MCPSAYAHPSRFLLKSLDFIIVRNHQKSNDLFFAKYCKIKAFYGFPQYLVFFFSCSTKSGKEFVKYF